MIFRNTFRLLLTNFSNVWKVLLYYIICIALTVAVCWSIAQPIINELAKANVFSDLANLLNSFFSTPQNAPHSLNQIINNAWGVLVTNIQFQFNYIFLIVWILLVFPFTLNLAQLALGEVLYGFMTSQVKYSFTGRYIKNIGKSCLFALVSDLVNFVFNAIIFSLFVGFIKLLTLGSFVYAMLGVLLFAVMICFVSFKRTLFACFMPAMAVLDCNPFKALAINFKGVFKNFFRIFSNAVTIVLTTIVVNLIFCVFTFSVSLIITLPLTAFVFVIFQMVSYFSSFGMRFYVYPDMFISPKRFEEQDKIKKIKYLV